LICHRNEKDSERNNIGIKMSSRLVIGICELGLGDSTSTLCVFSSVHPYL